MLLFLNISAFVNMNDSVHASLSKESSFTIGSANINKSNRDFPKIIGKLNAINADILLLLEVTRENSSPLQSLIQSYPYHVENLNIGSSGTGTVLMSRFPILSHKVTKYTEFGNMLIAATLEIADKKVAFYGVHFPKPTNRHEFSTRSMQIMSLAQQVSQQLFPVIIAGDFNSTPYSPVFTKFIERSGLRDSRAGFGMQPSWPTFFPPLLIPIDHILVDPSIEVLKRATGSYIGSDHYPVFAELSISNLKNTEARMNRQSEEISKLLEVYSSSVRNSVC